MALSDRSGYCRYGRGSGNAAIWAHVTITALPYAHKATSVSLDQLHLIMLISDSFCVWLLVPGPWLCPIVVQTIRALESGICRIIYSSNGAHMRYNVCI